MSSFTPIVTYLVIGLTALTSFMAFQNQDMKGRMLFYPYQIKRSGEWHRFITSGFIHANLMHLVFNMLVFYFFGVNVEYVFVTMYGGLGHSMFALMYLGGIAAAETYSYFKHRDNPAYASLGASGAVAAVLFAAIVMDPWMPITFLFFPFFDIPGFVIGILYLLYSAYMARRNKHDGIAHNAHFYGAVFGFIFPVLFKPMIIVIFFQRIIEGLPL